MHCETEGTFYGSLSFKKNKISPNCKGLVAVEFSFNHHLVLAPVETVGVPGNKCLSALGLVPTVTVVTSVAILVAVERGLSVAKFHLQII